MTGKAPRQANLNAEMRRVSRSTPPPPDRKYLQEGDMALNERMHRQFHLDLLDQHGPVLAHGGTPVQAVFIQHT